MKKQFLILIPILCMAACESSNSNNQTGKSTESMRTLANGQKMDTAYFWLIMDKAFEKGGLNNKVREQEILQQLVQLTPEQIQDFEIIFQQLNKKASTWGNFAAQTVIEGGSSDDTFFYFRCWLISMGQKIFDETMKNPDYLASLDIPKDKYGLANVEFEELIPMADRAYEIVTRKDPSTDTTFPRPHADKLGLFYDTNVDITGSEWTDNDELPKIVPQLCKKYLDK